MRPRLLLAVLLLTAFTLSAVDATSRSPFDPFRTAADAVLGPVGAVAGAVAGTAGNAVSAAGDLVDRSELERLREENDRLRRELATGPARTRRLGEWRDLLGLVDAGGWSVVPARVVAAGDALGFARTVTIDAGERDGLAVGQPVVAGPGLVGRTVRVGPWTATVLLLDDPQFGVGARLASTGALGLASGTSGGLRFAQVDDGPVEVGDVLLTSGSDTFVPDVPIGRVEAVQRGEGGLTTTADVEPLVDPHRVELVGVVVQPSRPVPRAPLGTSP